MHLGEEIGNLLRGGDVRKRDSANKIMMANKLKGNLKMFRLLMKNWIVYYLDGTPVVTIKRSQSSNGNTQVYQKPTKSNNLFGSREHSSILSLDSRKSNNLMFLAFS